MGIRLNKIQNPLNVENYNIILAKDPIGTTYLCVKLKECQYKYLCIQISEARINELLTGVRSLVECLLDAENQEYYIGASNNNTLLTNILHATHTEISPNEISDIAIGYPLIERSKFDDEIIVESRDKQRPVIFLGIKDPSNNHAVSIQVLSEVLTLYQSLVSNCHRKTSGSKQDIKFHVYKTYPASFNIAMFGDTPLDIVENNPLEKALATIDDIMTSPSEQEIKDKLTPLKGDTAQSFKKLITFLFKNSLELKHKWPKAISYNEVSTKIITRANIDRTYNVMMGCQELFRTDKEYNVIFYGVNSEKGTWEAKITDAARNQEIKGKTENPSILSGIIIDTQQYHIICVEVISSNNVRASNITELFLVDFNSI